MQWVTRRRVSRSHGDPYRVRLMVALPLSEQLAHLLERCPKLPSGASGGADELPDGLWDHPCVWLMCCCCAVLLLLCCCCCCSHSEEAVRAEHQLNCPLKSCVTRRNKKTAISEIGNSELWGLLLSALRSTTSIPYTYDLRRPRLGSVRSFEVRHLLWRELLVEVERLYRVGDPLWLAEPYNG